MIDVGRNVRMFLGGRRIPYRRAGLVVVAALVGGVVATLVTPSTPPLYRATAQLYVAPATNPTSAYQDVGLAQGLARSYAQLATADPVLVPAMQNLGYDNLTRFRALTEVAQVKDSSILTVSFRDADRQRAADGANAIARSFITQTQELQTALQGSAASQLDEQIASVQNDIKALEAQISSMRNENAARPSADLQAQILQLDASRQSKQQTLTQMLKTRDDMQLGAARANNSVYLWQVATPPVAPEPGRGLMSSLIGAGAAGAVTLALVLAVAYVDDRVRNADDLRAKLKLAPIAEIAAAPSPATFRGKLFLRDTPNAMEAEAFRALRTNVLFANIDERPRRLLVTSSLPREGKSVVSANLALAFAQAGTPTVLIDADLRRPAQQRLFDLKTADGLTTLLMESDPMAALERFRVTEHLIVVPSGPLPPNPAELLSSARMASLVNQIAVSRPSTTVIVDTSPVLAVPDAIALAAMMDGTVFVVDARSTHARICRRALEDLESVHAKILGGVLNNVSSGEAYRVEYYRGAKSAARAS